MSQIAQRERIAGEVRAEMARKRRSLSTVSGSTGIPKATLSRKVNALSDFTVTELLAVADALGVPAAGLLDPPTGEQVSA